MGCLPGDVHTGSGTSPTVQAAELEGLTHSRPAVCPAVFWSSGSSLCLDNFLFEWNIYSVPLYVRNCKYVVWFFFSRGFQLRGWLESQKRLSTFKQGWDQKTLGTFEVELNAFASWYGHGPKGARKWKVDLNIINCDLGFVPASCQVILHTVGSFIFNIFWSLMLICFLL